MLDSIIVVSSHEQSFNGGLTRLTEQALLVLSSAPTTIVPRNANDQEPKTQTLRNEKKGQGLLASSVSPIESRSSSSLQFGNQSKSEEGNHMSIHLDEYTLHPRTYEPSSSHPNTIVTSSPHFQPKPCGCTDQSSSDSYLRPCGLSDCTPGPEKKVRGVPTAKKGVVRVEEVGRS